MGHSSNLKFLMTLAFIAFWQYNLSAQSNDATVRIESSAHIDQMLAQKKDYNKTIEKFDGFKS